MPYGPFDLIMPDTGIVEFEIAATDKRISNKGGP